MTFRKFEKKLGFSVGETSYVNRKTLMQYTGSPRKFSYSLSKYVAMNS